LPAETPAGDENRKRRIAMASKIEFVEFIADQLKDAGTITYKKMFGEYGIYCDGKIFALICGDQFYVKITEAGRKLCPNLEEAPPYEGAKNYLLVDNTEDRELLTRLVTATCRQLPEPKPKKPRKKPSSGKP
jgi:TfoX/Sxy family transcriptional regulator of competence genes